MGISRVIGSLTKALIVGACIYGFVKWQSLEAESSESEAFATKACADEIADSHKLSDARPYKVDSNSSGYVVRASATTARGKPVKVVCLANSHGGINEILIDER